MLTGVPRWKTLPPSWFVADRAREHATAPLVLVMVTEQHGMAGELGGLHLAVGHAVVATEASGPPPVAAISVNCSRAYPGLQDATISSCPNHKWKVGTQGTTKLSSGCSKSSL